MSRASLDKDPRDVAAMFDDVASKYDVTNDVLSLGQDRLWRRAVVQACEAVPGQVVLTLNRATHHVVSGQQATPSPSHGRAQSGVVAR